MNVLLKIMTSSSHSNLIRSLKASIDGSHQAAHRAIKFTSCWNPLLWIRLATFSTIALLGLEFATTQTANAQTAIAQSNLLTTAIQTANDQLVNDPLTDDLLNGTAGVTESNALEVSLELNESANLSETFENNSGNDPEETRSGLNKIDSGTESDADHNEISDAIDEIGESDLDAFVTEQSSLEQSVSNQQETIQQDILARTENANQQDISQDASLIAQSSEPASPTPADEQTEPQTEPQIAQGGSALLGAPFVQLQGAVVVQGDEFSARARATASYAITPNVLVGGTLDLVTGDAFADSPESGLNLNELYIAVSPSEIPTLRFAIGLLDYTSYFDRNSFAKDGVTHFFNPVFQTNPALTAAGLSSRPGVLVNWSVTDNLELRAAGFSSRRDLGDFALDGFAAEAAVRVQNLILRGTFVTAEDAGDDSGFREIFQFDRGDGNFGLRSGDREQAYGINAEYFVPSIRLGLFARYGWYDNLDLGRGGETYSFGFNLLDLFLPDDRLGLAYGRNLSDEGLRQRRDDELPDVLELFYDARLLPNLRAGFTAQARNSFSETILGFRVRADFSLSDLGR
jgi:hypothetical protein